MAEIDVEAVLKKLTLAEKVDLLAGELLEHHTISSQLLSITSISSLFLTLFKLKYPQYTPE